MLTIKKNNGKIINVIAKAGCDSIATVYLAKNKDNKFIEFVESVQPPIPREEKWVLIVSTLFGCVVGCPMCDAGGWYQGKLTKEEILAQIDYAVKQRFPDGKIPCKNFKIQFARMGEPALNSAVLDVLEELPTIYNAPGLLPSFSTVAPAKSEDFFARLLDIKEQYYGQGNFQMQFSIHTTDESVRDKIIPIKKWNFAQVAEYGARFYAKGDKQITLNFALAQGSPFEIDVLRQYFDPKIFLIKLTPVNPTVNVRKNNVKTYFVQGDAKEDKLKIVENLQKAGYKVILSIGELEENKIGSNCGQYVKKFLGGGGAVDGALKGMYEYEVEAVN